jgi:hypothetical protein
VYGFETFTNGDMTDRKNIFKFSACNEAAKFLEHNRSLINSSADELIKLSMFPNLFRRGGFLVVVLKVAKEIIFNENR